MKIRDLFPGYYQPTEEEFKSLWEECIFSFDTNVLLHIYRYSPETKDRLFEILEKLQERIWIPHQVAYEIHKNRIDVIYHQSFAYKNIENILNENINIGSLTSKLFKEYKRHPFISIEEVIKIIERGMADVHDYLENTKEPYPTYLIHENVNFLKNDELWNQLINIIDDKIGIQYKEEEYKNKCKDVEQRFKDLIPPGYKDDKEKKTPEKYGDALIWFQLIDYAKDKKKPIIFITDDNKDDWWLKHNGKTISPRPELIQEMLIKAGVKFYMYQSDGFLKYAESYLHLSEKPKAIQEARDIKLSINININKKSTPIKIEIIDDNDTPVSDAHIVLCAENSTYLESFTDNNGVATLDINPSKNYIGLIAHQDFSSTMIRNFPIGDGLAIKLENKNNIGSVIFSRGTGYIKGLEGRLNPILDTFGRTYMYAENVAINGGMLQPVDFNIDEAIYLEDSKGNVAQIIIRFISSNISLVDFVTNIS